MAIGVRRSFLKVNGLFFLVAFVMRWERIESVQAIWNKAFSQINRVLSISFLCVSALGVVLSKTQLSPIQRKIQKTHGSGAGSARRGMLVKALRAPVYKEKNLKNSFF